jgi:hypothetical protein
MFWAIWMGAWSTIVGHCLNLAAPKTEVQSQLNKASIDLGWVSFMVNLHFERLLKSCYSSSTYSKLSIISRSMNLKIGIRGAVLSPAVIPVALTVGWSKLTAAGVLCGSIIGAILGILAWMIGCLKIYGRWLI